MTALTSHRQSLTPGAEVELLKLDLNPIGTAVIYYFCSDYGVTFNGQAYTHMPVKIEGLERNVGEQNPPKLSLPNVSKFSSGLVAQYKDLVGAELTRTTTFEKFLDGAPAADPTAILEQDTFVIEQKLNLNKLFGEWELRVLGDTGDRFVGRSANKEICPYVYRHWDGAAFVVSPVRPCPYANNTYLFNTKNEATTNQADDACDNTVAGGCTARKLGWASGTLGFGGFPGMSRFRI